MTLLTITQDLFDDLQKEEVIFTHDPIAVAL